ncbi:hypothetical protein R3P38DRAFT_3185217 [Favolaschia claudopus]|uniref:Uncharacterized protein n=1 Tax=Favolaschia claudopus TaxID=2862362 RepID=A0AAW0C5E7_9AGAR
MPDFRVYQSSTSCHAKRLSTWPHARGLSEFIKPPPSSIDVEAEDENVTNGMPSFLKRRRGPKMGRRSWNLCTLIVSPPSSSIALYDTGKPPSSRDAETPSTRRLAGHSTSFTTSTVWLTRPPTTREDFRLQETLRPQFVSTSRRFPPPPFSQSTAQQAARCYFLHLVVAPPLAARLR